MPCALCLAKKNVFDVFRMFKFLIATVNVDRVSFYPI